METDDSVERNLSINNVISPKLERCLQKKKPQKRNRRDEGTTETQYSIERRKRRQSQQQSLRDTRLAAMKEIESRIPMVWEAMKENGNMQENEKMCMVASYTRQQTFAEVAKEVFSNLLIRFPTAKWNSEPEGNEMYMVAVSHAGHFTGVTKKVEEFLGMKMNDLFANYLTLFDFTHPGETNKLMKILKPDEFSSVSNVATENFDMQRRACQLNLAQVLDGNNIQIRYETFVLNGYLIVPKEYYVLKQDDENRKREVEQKLFLTCVLTPWKDYKLNFPVLFESWQYTTRHCKDGRIIDADHRINFITKHLFEEVRGKTAFIFMHKHDVRWVLIATRHMLYVSTEGNGSSCYRLQTKCGRFICLQTVGYLDADPNSESFLCINTVLSEDEYKKAMKALRDRFSVYINTQEPGFNTLVEGIAENDNDIDSSSSMAEEPDKLQELLTAMLLNSKSTPATSNVERDSISSGSSTLQPSACIASTSSTKDDDFPAPPGSIIDEVDGIWEMNIKSASDATSSVERDSISSGSSTPQPSACVASTSSTKGDDFPAPPGSTIDEVDGIWEMINEQIPQYVARLSSDEYNASNSLLSPTYF